MHFVAVFCECENFAMRELDQIEIEWFGLAVKKLEPDEKVEPKLMPTFDSNHIVYFRIYMYLLFAKCETEKCAVVYGQFSC